MIVTEAAKKMGMNQPWGSEWCTHYKSEGFDGLDGHSGSGRLPKVAKD